MATLTLEICPKCKGYLMLEKDNYGLYQQCLQCGYVHDLQTLGWVDKKQAGEKKVEASQRVTAESSDDEPQNTPQLTGYSQNEYLAFPPDLQSILNHLLKERQNKPHHQSSNHVTAL